MPVKKAIIQSFQIFLMHLQKSIGKKNISITTLPKKTEAGNPDFRVWDGRQHIVGRIILSLMMV